MKVLKWIVIFFLIYGPLTAQVDPVWKNCYDSTQYFWARDWTRTVNLLERAERGAALDLGVFHSDYLTILSDLGTAYWKDRQYDKAEKTLTRTLRLKSEVYSLNDKEVVLSLSNLAGLYAERGHWKKSSNLYKRILSIDPAHIPGDIYVSAAQNLVSLYDQNQRPDSADYLLRRIELLNFIAPGTYADYQHQFYRARVQRSLHQYVAAESGLQVLTGLLAGRPEPEMKELYIQALQEQGILLLQTGTYGAAEKTLLKAYDLVTTEMNREHLLTELSNNLARVYDKLNIHDKALFYYQESLGRCRESYPENSLPCVTLENNIAGIHLKQNNTDRAIADYLRVTRALESLVTPADPLYITALNNLATAYRKSGRHSDALAHLIRAQNLMKEGGLEKDDLYATLLNNIAIVHTATGNYRKAAACYKEAYDIRRSLYGDNSVALMDLAGNLAVAYWALNDADEAIPLFKKSMSMAIRQVTYVFPNLNENEQLQFYEKLREDFERFNTIAIQWADKDDELLAQVFQNRAVIKSLRLFTEQRRRNLIAEKNDPTLNEVAMRLKERRDRLGHLYQLPLDQMKDAGEITALEKEIDALEKTLSLAANEDDYNSSVIAERAGWRSLLSRLQPNEAVVEVVRYRKYDRQENTARGSFGFADSVHYAALIVTSDTQKKPAMVLLRDGNNMETRFFNYYRNTLRYGVQDDLSWHFFWAPLESALKGRTKIYFSADGVYHKLNVNTFRDPVSGKFLLEKLDIVYLLNPIHLLKKGTRPVVAGPSAVLMGDPVYDVNVDGPRERTLTLSHFAALPGTQQEIRAIDGLLKANSWKTSLFLKGAATESNLKSVHSPAILHIASHGFFSDEVVMLNASAKREFLFHSGIVLSGANKSLSEGSASVENDGIVTAYEVMNLDLAGTGLVVLSACETGLGKVENGEGVFGLQRSFMQAGADNVLISLWKVDDEATRDLMISFYEYVAAGESFAASLKKAQADQARRIPNPALWGGFVLVGNP